MPVTNGAELVRKLKATGTPDSKLAAARKVLEETFRDTGEVAEAEAVFEAIADAWPGSLLLDKAREIIETGTYKTPESKSSAETIEEQLLKAPAKK